MSAIREIQNTVLALPLEQRVLLAELLLDSLPPWDESRSEADDIAEAQRRECEIETGHVQPVCEAEFWRRVEAIRARVSER